MRVIRRFVLVVLLVFSVWTLSAGGQGVKAPDPILILVSFDAWRWDLIDRATVPNLRALAARGVRAEGLIPPFPSKTFPSHYTTVTGLYPAHHGIVSNSIWDDAIGERFTMQAPTAKDSRWWSGEPLWVTAVTQGRRSASMFWPGSEVEIGGVRPSEYRPFDDAFPNSGRVQQVLTWLSLPDGQRPSFITVYFSDVDTASHSYGPESPETLAAAARLDAALGDLVTGVAARGLADRTSIVVTSDHGISPQAPDRRIVLDDYVDLATVNIVDMSPVLHIAPRTGTVADLYARLHDKHPALAVYRREDLPAYLHYSGNSRIQPIIALAADGWAITTRERFDRDQKEQRFSKGDHGYDGRYRSMHGLFVAAGPTLRRGMVVPAFESVHLYELMCRMLGLTPAKNDGDPSVTRGFLTGSQVLGFSHVRPALAKAEVLGPVALSAAGSVLADQAQFRSGTDVVEVHATVKLKDGTIAHDLTRDDFELFEDGKRRDIVVFSQSIQPLSVSLVLDHSSSARSEFPSIRLAAQEFVGHLLPPDRVSISTLTWDCPPFTHDSLTLMSLLRTNLPSDMGSPIWSATDRAMSSLESENGRRVIVLLSDGDDNGNSMPAGKAQIHPFDHLAGRIHSPCEPASIDPKQSIGKVISRAERDAVMVYTVVVQPSDASSTSGPADLARLALRSGAEVRQLGSYTELRSAFARIADELHLQYLLGFVPAAFDGKRHEIEVKSTRPGVRVRGRQAFIATRSGK